MGNPKYSMGSNFTMNEVRQDKESSILLTRTCFACILLSCFCLAAKLCLTLCDPMDCSPPGFSVHGISQTRILEWVAISLSSRSAWPRNQTHISCLADKFLTTEASEEAPNILKKHGLIFLLTHSPEFYFRIFDNRPTLRKSTSPL